MTEANLKSAYAGESQAIIRYTIYAKKAREEWYSNVARLQKYHEQRRITHCFNGCFRIQSTSDNLQACIDGETFEIKEMYPAYKKIAEFQGEKGAEIRYTWALEAEKIHASLYQKARQAANGGGDVDLGSVQICQVCGYTVEGEAPERCLICKVVKERFKAFWSMINVLKNVLSEVK